MGLFLVLLHGLRELGGGLVDVTVRQIRLGFLYQIAFRLLCRRRWYFVKIFTKNNYPNETIKEIFVC
jgi:hypothetical protein